MGHRVKIQRVDRGQTKSYYVNFPVAVAEAARIVKGEEMEWLLEDRNTFVLRRARPERIAGRLQAGELMLDRTARRVRRGERDIHLGPTEFRLLEHLMEKPGRVFSRAQLLDSVWGDAAEIDERTVDVQVGRLRKAIVRGRERDPLRTVRGAGYAFDETFGKA